MCPRGLPGPGHGGRRPLLPAAPPPLCLRAALGGGSREAGRDQDFQFYATVAFVQAHLLR
jgi:hypothetical protein